MSQVATVSSVFLPLRTTNIQHTYGLLLYVVSFSQLRGSHRSTISHITYMLMICCQAPIQVSIRGAKEN